MPMLLLLSTLAWAVPTKTLEAGIDRRVLLVDAQGRQIDCSLVAVEEERLVVRLEDGSLASVERVAVANLVDLGPAPPPPEIEEEEPEDDFGEDPLEEVEDTFDVEEALDELLVEDGGADAPEPVEEPEPVDPEPLEPTRAELPAGSLDEDDGWEEPEVVEAPEIVEAPEVVEESSEVVEETSEIVEEGGRDGAEEAPEAAVADLEPPPEVEAPKRDPQADADLYYQGRADGAAAAKGNASALPQGVGFAAGCVGTCIGCAGATLTFALVEPEVPSGTWQDEEALYQQGYLQAYRDTHQREAARRAFIGGALGTATTTVVAIALVSQL